MAKGILIDVGFTSDIKEYLEQIENDFKKNGFWAVKTYVFKLVPIL